jgi:hypothetical protein
VKTVTGSGFWRFGSGPVTLRVYGFGWFNSGPHPLSVEGPVIGENISEGVRFDEISPLDPAWDME